jgi:isopentenyl-diphosphate delta-isomerase
MSAVRDGSGVAGAADAAGAAHGREVVVLLDEAGHSLGTADKATVHGVTTPLHLAFSAYLFAPDGRFLLSQRAAAKLTFPGVWTNSVCGHPGPGEGLEAAARRRARLELGLPGEAIEGLRLVLPDFRYRASMHGVEEHEMCPVLVGWLALGAVVNPDPSEVGAVAFADWTDHVCRVLTDPAAWSPWMVAQVRALADLGPDPRAWPVGDSARLPPAARF